METVEIGQRTALGRILFATDFSPYSDTALLYALALARKYGARLYGSHVVSSDDYLFTAPDLWPKQMEEEGKLQREVEKRLDQQLCSMPHELLVGTGDATSVLLEQIKENYIDLLVVGSHGRTGTRRLLMGSIAEKLFRQTTCPVLIVGPNVPRKAENEIQFRSILLATDFGEHSLAALPFTLSLAGERQARLTLLHVKEIPIQGTVELDDLEASLKEQLQALIPQEAEAWCEVECLVQFRRTFVTAAEQILDVAKERGADLIVVGVRPLHGAIGPVTHMAHTTDQHILAHATCPVLTVRA
jgi:nucleotide-binding universal stress UspA family protein